MNQVIITYANENRSFAEALCSALNTVSNVTAVLAEREAEPARPLWEKVTSLISDSHWYIPVLTDEALCSQWVNQELGYVAALDPNRSRIIPVTQNRDKLKGFITKQHDLPFEYVPGNEQGVITQVCEHVERVIASSPNLLPIGNRSSPVLSVREGKGEGWQKLDQPNDPEDSRAVFDKDYRFTIANEGLSTAKDVSFGIISLNLCRIELRNEGLHGFDDPPPIGSIGGMVVYDKKFHESHRCWTNLTRDKLVSMATEGLVCRLYLDREIAPAGNREGMMFAAYWITCDGMPPLVGQITMEYDMGVKPPEAKVSFGEPTQFAKVLVGKRWPDSSESG